MALIRGFSKVEEESKSANPTDIRGVVGLIPGHVVGIEVIRVKGTSQLPHLVVHNPSHFPFFSPLEVVMTHGFSLVDGEGKIAIVDNVWEEEDRCQR